MNYKDKFEFRSYYLIDYSDFDEIVRFEYDWDDFESCLDQSNGSYIKISGVSGGFTLNDQERLEELLNSKNQSSDSILLLLNDLCRNHKVEPGDYLIKIFW